VTGEVSASLRLRSVEVELGGWVFRIDPLPAADWIEAVLTEDLAAIFPGLLRDRGLEGDVWAMLLDGTADRADLVGAGQRALADASGRSWWEAQRLVHAATEVRTKPVVFGALVRAGFDFQERSLGAFLDAVYSFAVEGATDEARLRLDTELRSPPPGVDEQDVYSDEEAEADFLLALGDSGSGA
jgi:hypothetical protein